MPVLTYKMLRSRRTPWVLTWILVLAGILEGMADARIAIASDAELRALADSGRVWVRQVIDGDTVVLDSGRQVRLTGIQAPKLPLGRPNFVPWPLADEARLALQTLAQGRPFTLRQGIGREDRHGRLLGHLVREDGAWMQGEMLRLGLARVYTFADNRALAGAMYRLEGQARAAQRGIWRDPFYALRSPEDVAKDIGSFQVIEGEILEVAKVGSRVYLNFGADWRNDFTVALDAAALRRFAAEGLDPLDWRGQRVRVRGWVARRNGPMIEPSHPEQVELLGRSQVSPTTPPPTTAGE